MYSTCNWRVFLVFNSVLFSHVFDFSLFFSVFWLAWVFFILFFHWLLFWLTLHFIQLLIGLFSLHSALVGLFYVVMFCCFLIGFVYKFFDHFFLFLLCSLRFHLPGSVLIGLKLLIFFLIGCLFIYFIFSLARVIELDLISNVVQRQKLQNNCVNVNMICRWFLGWILTTRTERDPANFQGTLWTCFQKSHQTTHIMFFFCISVVLLFFCCVMSFSSATDFVPFHLMFCVLVLWFLSVYFLFKGAVFIVSLRPMVKSLRC